MSAARAPFDRATLDKLFQYCMALCNNPDEAYDLLYGAIEKFLGNAPEQVDNPTAYIRRIARNAFFDQRRRAHIVMFEPLPEDDVHDSEEPALEALVIDQLTMRQVWDQLTPAEREVLYLWAVLELSATEIGVQLSHPRSTVLSRIRRVRQRIDRLYSAQMRGGGHA